MKARVLIIEDVKELSRLMALYLGKEGIETRETETAEEGLSIIGDWPCDLVLLDINLPGMDGFEFLGRFRRDHSVPVLIVSARNSDEDIITGLGYGADEFVTKPFSPRVLVARVRALLRRSQEQPSTGNGADEGSRAIRFGPFIFDRDTYILKRGTERISLSAKEYSVLEYLIEHAEKPQSPERIYNAVWKGAYGDLTAVAVYIQRLRKKLEDDPSNPRYIETVHGMGYRFNQLPPAEVTR